MIEIRDLDNWSSLISSPREEVLSGLAVLEERVRDVETDLQEVEKQQQEITYSQVREIHIYVNQ